MANQLNRIIEAARAGAAVKVTAELTGFFSMVDFTEKIVWLETESGGKGLPFASLTSVKQVGEDSGEEE